jgi:hypothetical protein
MSIVAPNQFEQKKLEPTSEFDRWSFVLIMLIISVAVFLLFAKFRFYGGLGIAASGLAIAFLSKQPGRIHRNSYKGTVLYKGETDCGFSTTPTTTIDGLAIVKTHSNNLEFYTEKQVYKTANGTDIVIDAAGNVQPCGFGTLLINKLDNAGYQNGVTPDGCWVID